MFSHSLEGDNPFPPRCCGLPISFDKAKRALDDLLIRRYLARRTELSGSRNTYCHEPTCSALIPRNRIFWDTCAICRKCGSRTCTVCKAAYHRGCCVDDQGTLALRSLARREGWRQCSRCFLIVERARGCNHITCRCGFGFCYLCGAAWRTCHCGMFPGDEQAGPVRGQLINSAEYGGVWW